MINTGIKTEDILNFDKNNQFLIKNINKFDKELNFNKFNSE